MKKRESNFFKESKKAPIKLRGFRFIGYHDDYSRCAYYYKDLGNENYELMECILEGERKPEIGAGTKVVVLDSFMTTYAKLTKNGEQINNKKEFIEYAVNNCFPTLEKPIKLKLIEAYNSAVPREVTRNEIYKKYKNEDYKVLYCHDDESAERKIGIVNIILVKNTHICSEDKTIDIDRHYTIFKPLKFMVKPSFLKGESKEKYYSEELPTIAVNHDLIK